MEDTLTVVDTEDAIKPWSQPSASGFVESFDVYQGIQKAIDERMPDAIMVIQKNKFRKKAYWRAVAAAFNLDVKPIVDEYFVADDDWGYKVTYLASFGGHERAGDGTCMRSEKLVYDYEWVNNRRGKRLGLNADKTADNATHHNIRGHAHTRAFNRAVSNLVGFGEVSAEEMPTNSYAPADKPKAARKPAQAAPKAQRQASAPEPTPRDDGDWDGQKEVFFGKYAKTEPPTKWRDTPTKYLEWIVEKMSDPSKGPAGKMAAQELGRRAMLDAVAANVVLVEAHGDVVDAEVLPDREPGEDDDLFGPASDDPRFQ